MMSHNPGSTGEEMTDTKPRVLFLCTANTCRSQMAEALLRHLAGDRFEALSAGPEPGPEVHPLALRVLEEKGVSTVGLRPKHIREYLGRVRLAAAIIVCSRAAETCPAVWPGMGERLYWPVDDPAAVEGGEEEKLAAFRRARDFIETRLTDWLAGA
jgi:arsenate reductase